MFPAAIPVPCSTTLLPTTDVTNDIIIQPNIVIKSSKNRGLHAFRVIVDR